MVFENMYDGAILQPFVKLVDVFAPFSPYIHLLNLSFMLVLFQLYLACSS